MDDNDSVPDENPEALTELQDTLVKWVEWVDEHKVLPPELVQHIGISYLLRKWAALQVFRLDEANKDDKPQTLQRIPVRLPGRAQHHDNDDDDEGEGGTTGWFIYDDDTMLGVARPDILGDYAGLACFNIAVAQMMERAIEKGWHDVGLFGYGADFAWVEVEKLNMVHNEEKIDIKNYQPTEGDCQRYATFIMDLVNQAKVQLSQRSGGS